MPPIRTYPAVKPIKTERTHEENQERAYIAASRRSDRSLEARVESARRASEIHKRRTGRSLRVTEQDVVNEEMYEEEDDDLPAQYRRLTAHLNTGSTDFNRRLTAYLSNHLAMRNALGQALSNSYQQYPNGTSWAQSMQSTGSQQWSQDQGQMPLNNLAMNSPQMMQNSPPPFGQSPYAAPASQSSRPQLDLRSMTSSSQVPEDAVESSEALAHSRPKHSRRASEPVHLTVDVQSNPSANEFNKSSSASPFVQKAKTSGSDPSATLGSIQEELLHHPNPSRQPSLPTPSSLTSSSHAESNNLGPLSTVMPPEAQMFTSIGFNPNDPFGQRTYNTNEKNNAYFNDFNTNPVIRHPALHGMNQTLAPSALETHSNDMNWGLSASEDMGAPFSAPPFTYNLDSALVDPFGKQGLPSDGQASGQVTPDREWTSFIDQSSWDDGTN